MESLTINTRQFKDLHYRKAGQGQAVMLLHGFPENGTLWNEVVPALANSFTVLVPDIPGSGESPMAEEPVSMEDLAGAMAGILDYEGIEEAAVVGHSMGGYVALAFAEHHRAWLKGLALVHSTAIADSEEKKETRRKAIGIIQKGGKEAFIKGMIPGLFSEQFRERHPDIIRRQVDRGMALQAESMVSFYNTMINRPDRTDVLKDARFPVQWIMGAEDMLMPVSGLLRQSSLAQVNFVSIYGESGHMSMLELPERLANDLKEFIVYCFNR